MKAQNSASEYLNRKVIIKAPQYPQIGQEIECDITKIRQDDAANGTATTAMTKIRYNFETAKWDQVSPASAGMYVFFTNEPEVIHKSFRVLSIIPSRTGCYAELL